MNNDEMFLRYHLRKWERRFVDGLHCDILLLIRVKDAYRDKYGLEELQRVVQDETHKTSKEICADDLLFVKRNKPS